MNKHPHSNSDPSILITALVDGELSNEEKRVLAYQKQINPYLDKLEASERTIKTLLKERLPRHKAPDRLRQRIQTKLEEEKIQKDTNISPIKDNSGSDGNNKPDNFFNTFESGQKEEQNFIHRYFPQIAIAASVLLVTGILYLSLQSQNTPSKGYPIEEYAMQHFMEHKTILENQLTKIPDTEQAEQYSQQAYKMSMVIPRLSQSVFKGIGYTEFVPGYKTPYLVYAQPKLNETIFIFTFDVKHLQNHPTIKRNAIAVQQCIGQKDYYVQNVNGKHVVSWKWDDTWYTAISNHDGNQLAGLVNPLN